MTSVIQKRKVRLDFCDFWPGFAKANNFFYNLLRERFEVEICDEPDFLIFANLEKHVHRVHNCVKIYVCVEDFAPDFSLYDYAFTCRHHDNPRHLRLPYFALRKPDLIQKRGDNFGEILASKTKFCAMLVGYANKKTRVRNEFFEKLCRYKKVDSAGGALNNMGWRVPPGHAAKLDFLRPYKFNLAFENASVPGYVTEKLVDAMEARALPIYWGHPEVSRDFNTKSFLNYSDFPSADALIERIVELDADDSKYLDLLKRPYFYNDVPNDSFDHKRLLDFFEGIFTTPVNPVSARRHPLQVGRWIPVRKNRLRTLF